MGEVDSEREDATVEVSRKEPKQPADVREELSLGTAFGRYVLLERVAAGGMGRIMRAYDPKLQREVALKVLRPDLVSNLNEARLLREAQAMAKLNHPNVVTVYDVELVLEDVVVVMEFVQGQSLQQWLQRRRPIDEVLRVLTAAGRGLAAAHDVGLVHRDFKPGNVLLGDDGRVRVGDFGLALLHHDSGWNQPTPLTRDSTDGHTDDGSKQRLTEVGTVIGTPAYMSPEQLDGAPLDARSDLYAFCLTLWEALCGQRPFKGTRREVRQAKLDGPPPWPSDVRVPSRIASAIRKGLAPSPRDRWRSMEELIAALEVDPRRRVGRAVAGVAVVGSMAAGGFTLQAWQSSRPEPCGGAELQLVGVWDAERSEAVHRAMASSGAPYAEQAFVSVRDRLDAFSERWVATHRDACEATAVRAEQSARVLDLRMSCLHRARRDLAERVDVLAEADAAVVRNAVQAVQGLGGLERCSDPEALLDEVAPPDPGIAPTVEALRDQLARGKSLHSVGRFALARAVVEPTVEQAQNLGYAPLIAETLFWRARMYEALGQAERARDAAAEALQVALEHDHHRAAVWAANTMAFVVAARLVQPDEGDRLSGIALGLARQRHEGQVEEAEVHNTIGASRYHAGRYEEAIVAYERSLAIYDKQLGPTSIPSGFAHNNIGLSYERLGRLEEAEQSHRRALELFRQVLGSEHPYTASVHDNLGLVLSLMGRHDEAIANHQISLALRHDGPDASPAMIAQTTNNFALTLIRAGRLEQGIERYREALRMADELGMARHPNTAIGHHGLGAALTELGQLDEAIEHHHTAVSIFEETLGADHPEMASLLIPLAKSLNAARRYDHALRALERAEPLLKARTGKDTVKAEAALARAQALWELGKDRPEAIRRAELSLALLSGGDLGGDAPRVRGEAEQWLATHRLPTK